jgi:hypothetical protein
MVEVKEKYQDRENDMVVDSLACSADPEHVILRYKSYIMAGLCRDLPLPSICRDLPFSSAICDPTFPVRR